MALRDSEPTSPLDELLARFQDGVHLRKRSLLDRLGALEGALTAYRLAVEEESARELSASHGLKAPKGRALAPRAAAEALLRAVESLPELRGVRGDKAAEVPAASLAEPSPERPAATVATTAFPKILARSESSRLVIVGALSGRRRSFPEPWAKCIEWLDTSSGVNAAIGNLATRIRQGRVLGLVLCDQAIQHKHATPLVAAARAAQVPVAFADKGGAQALLRAFEAIEGSL